MAEQKSAKPKGDELLDFEEAFDDAFGAYMAQPCDWRRIRLTQTGWQAKVQFAEVDLFNQTQEESMDLETLKFWAAQNLFDLEEDAGEKIVTLKHNSSAKEDYFPVDVADVLGKHAVEAHAYSSGLHDEITEASRETGEKVEQALDWQETQWNLEALANLNFQSIIIVLPPNMKEIQEQAVKAFQSLCAEEELDFSQEEDQWGITIILSKQRDVEYKGSMEPAYTRLFQKLAQLEGVEVVVE